MSRTRLIIIIIAIGVVLTLLIRGCLHRELLTSATVEKSDQKHKSDDTISPVVASEQKSKAAKVFETFVSVIYTPVVFYGKVVDQDGNPVSGVDVSVSVSDKVGGGGSKLKLHSGNDGRFQVNTRGMSIYVKVSKDGYYSFPSYDAAAGKTGRISANGFDYGQDFGKGIHQPDNIAPVIFTLYHPTPPPDLVRISSEAISLARDGTMVVHSLQSKVRHFGKSVTLRCWTNDGRKLNDGRYDWRMEIAVPNGQLQPRLDEFDFIAPEAGYTNIQTIEMPASLPKTVWHDDVAHWYWVKYSDGTFGRLQIRMIAGGDHFALVDGYLNPQPGSRNLEADPKQR